jgi:DNA-binding IclR family transcriptional regulator
VGMYVDAHACALGKALLAYRAPRIVEELYRSGPLRAHTARTITSVRMLLDDLARVRARGWAEDIQETAVGLSCVAAPIVNPLGLANMAISISGPAAWMTPSVTEQLGKLAARTATDLARHIVERVDDDT